MLAKSIRQLYVGLRQARHGVRHARRGLDPVLPPGVPGRRRRRPRGRQGGVQPGRAQLPVEDPGGGQAGLPGRQAQEDGGAPGQDPGECWGHSMSDIRYILGNFFTNLKVAVSFRNSVLALFCSLKILENVVIRTFGRTRTVVKKFPSQH